MTESPQAPTDPFAQADAWLAELTLEEKITLLSGASTWRTVPIERLGIPIGEMKATRAWRFHEWWQRRRSSSG